MIVCDPLSYASGLTYVLDSTIFRCVQYDVLMTIYMNEIKEHNKLFSFITCDVSSRLLVGYI